MKIEWEICVDVHSNRSAFSRYMPLTPNGKHPTACLYASLFVCLFFSSRVQISLRYILFNNLNSDQLKSGANETDLCINDAFSVI